MPAFNEPSTSCATAQPITDEPITWHVKGSDDHGSSWNCSFKVKHRKQHAPPSESNAKLQRLSHYNQLRTSQTNSREP